MARRAFQIAEIHAHKRGMTPFRSADCILMYHGTPERDGPRLARQLRAVAAFFDVVPLEQLGQRGAARRRKGRRRVALTFDDGLRSNVRVAYPLLCALGLPATFFVCPGLIERRSWLWNHEARQRLYSLDGPALAAFAAAMGAPADVEDFVDWMKMLKLAERRRVEDEIRAATPRFAASAAQREEFDIAGWDELKRLDPRVVAIGSHTMTHPILTSLSPDQREDELRESRASLERELGRPVSAFCYPNGDLDEDTVTAARRHYGCAVTVEPRSLEGDVDPHRLPRFAAHPRGSLRLARSLAFG
jgi:peptidoglycan/xylan/chitin deacetylase (PgdA/CDA1 family)